MNQSEYVSGDAGRLARVAIRLLADIPTLTIADASRYLGVSKTTISKLRTQLGLPRITGKRCITPRMHARQAEPFAIFCDEMWSCLVGRA